ncbi:unnamed protein product [Pleuronectes platessa]|uniref:Secreted protein n=1 Tax=Pleuronectes platessa TaxID=8262 RepID=A0A9N7VJK9_PLEPL|nr:unnamed protein product [Pleuronectes platessa]
MFFGLCCCLIAFVLFTLPRALIPSDQGASSNTPPYNGLLTRLSGLPLTTQRSCVSPPSLQRAFYAPTIDHFCLREPRFKDTNSGTPSHGGPGNGRETLGPHSSQTAAIVSSSSPVSQRRRRRRKRRRRRHGCNFTTMLLHRLSLSARIPLDSLRRVRRLLSTPPTPGKTKLPHHHQAVTQAVLMLTAILSSGRLTHNTEHYTSGG